MAMAQHEPRHIVRGVLESAVFPIISVVFFICAIAYAISVVQNREADIRMDKAILRTETQNRLRYDILLHQQEQIITELHQEKKGR